MPPSLAVSLLNGALSGITADWFGLLLAALSFLAMRSGKFGMVTVLAVCAGLGFLWKWLV